MQDGADGACTTKATLPLSWNVTKDKKRGAKHLVWLLAGTEKPFLLFLRLLLIISASYSFWGVSFEFNHPVLHTNNPKNKNNSKIKLSMFLLEAGEKRGGKNRLVNGPIKERK